MAGTTFCDVPELYNILNQYTRLSRLPEFNYLCLIGKRSVGSDCHIGSTRFKQIHCDSKGKFIMPECMRNIVLCVGGWVGGWVGEAMECAEALTKSNRYPVQILKGGYRRFSALNPFFRTQNILHTIKELESLRPYTVELLSGQLYLGDYKQAINPHVLKDLKLSALVNVSEDTSHVLEKGNHTILHINVSDSVDADLYSSFERICVFIGSRLNTGSADEIFSSHRISRCSAAAMAFLLHHLKYTIGEAWEHVLQCKTNMRPNRGFVQQLSDWELHTLGRRMTDIAVPCY
uniref:Serine/threonine/tyrosine interacting-like 1 n=1 Tax=Salmo trutta TaxID=8032 RepID=A0A673YZV1_SALTR